MKTKPQQSLLGKIVGITCLSVLSAASVQAALWQGGTASYNNAANWDNGLIPSAVNTGNAINRSGAANIMQVNSGDPNWTLGGQDILLGDVGGSSGSYYQDGPTVTLNFWFRMALGGGTSSGYATVNSGTLNIGGQLNVSEGGVGVFNNTNTGVVNIGGEFWMGQGGGANATVNLGGSAAISAGSWAQVGRGGATGTLNMSGSSTFTKTGGGNFIVGDNSTGTLNQSGTSALSINNELWVAEGGASSSVYNMKDSASVVINSWVAIGRDGGTGVVNMTNNASITKSGANVFIIGASGPGTLNQDGGTVTVSTLDSWLGESGAGVWNQNSGSNILAFVQFGRNASASGVLNLNGGSFAANQIASGSGSSTLNFNGGTLRARTSTTSFMTGVPGYLQAGGAVIDSAGNNVTISSALADGASGNLTKVGSGTLTLSGANTYIGNTTVSAGKLIEGTASTVTTPVTVASTAGYGVKTLAANGQVTHGTVTFSGSGSLDFDLGGFGNPTTAPLNVSSTLTVGGTITVNISASVLAVGTIPLATYPSLAGNPFVLGTLPAGVVATLNKTATQLQLVITSAGAPRWDGAALGTWNIGANTDWFDLGTLLPTTYQNGQPVVFDDAALGTTTVTLNAGTYTPSSVTVTNDTLAYTFTGAGAIGGTTSLAKSGTNSLTIAATNSYTGPTLISGGTLSINRLANGGANSSIGSSSANATNLVLTGGKLSYTGPAVVTDRGYTLNAGDNTLDIQNDVTFNGALSANAGGNFIKTGNGTLFVKRTGANTLSSGGGGQSYQIRNGTVIMDGSAGAQVNTINGEIWPGATDLGTGGNLILTNTTLNLSSWLAIARGTGTGGYTSSVAMYNSTLRSVNGSIAYDNNIAGTLQTGFLTLNGTSTYTNTGDSNFGESTGGTAIITLNDSSVYYGNNRAMVGWHNAGTGTLAIANSAKVVVNAWLSIGNEGGVGSVLVKDTGTLVTTGDLNVCDVNAGNGDLIAKDNSVVNANNIFVGKGAGSVGTMTITNNATVVSTNGITIGNSGGSTGTLNLDGGSLSVNLAQGQGAGSTTINFNGGKITAHAPYFGPDFVFNLTTANVLAGGAVIEIVTNDVRSIPQPLLDGGTGGGLTKLGTGTLFLNGVNTYTGNTVATGTLGGSGTIAGNVTAQHLSPGDVTGVGQLTIGGNLSFSGDLNVDVATSVSPSNDVIAVTGTITRTGTGSVKVSNLGPVLTVGQKFYLFNGAIVPSAGTMAVTGGGATWVNRLAIDGSIQVLTVLPAPTFTPGSVATLPDGNKSITATGTIGSTYRLWASSDVTLTPITTTWTLLSSGTVTTSPFTINDLSATNFTKRFYIFSTP